MHKNIGYVVCIHTFYYMLRWYQAKSENSTSTAEGNGNQEIYISGMGTMPVAACISYTDYYIHFKLSTGWLKK